MSHEEHQTCALTGATGYIGSHCERRLRQLGFSVLRLVRHRATEDDVCFRLGEPLDPKFLRGVDSLIHCAYDFGAKSWEEVQRINVRGSESLLRSAQAAGVRRLVFISSVSAFEGCASLYGQGKLMVERLAAFLGAIVLRPGLVYGEPGRGMFGALSRLSRLRVLPVFDGGRQPMALVHIEDLTQTMVQSLRWDALAVGGPVTLAHPKPVAFLDILQTIASKKSLRLKTLSIPGWMGLSVLRLAEAGGLPLRFRSDSLLSLLQPNPNLDFSSAEKLGLKFRCFLDVEADAL